MTTIRELQRRAYRQSGEKGFHDDYPHREDFADTPGGMLAYGTALQSYHANKMMLIVGEASEAHEQLREGKQPDHTYYPTINAMPGSFDPAFAVGKHKPEGIPSEIADIVIRCADYAEIAGFDLEAIILEKLDYNATRTFKHGKKF